MQGQSGMFFSGGKGYGASEKGMALTNSGMVQCYAKRD